MDHAAAPAPGIGFDPAGLDRSVRPQDDFYRFVNGGWLDRTAIPPDWAHYGAFHELHEQAERDLRAIVEEMAAATAPPGSDGQKVGDFHRSYMDEAWADALGLYPLRGELERLAGLRTRGDVVRAMAHLVALGVEVPVHAAVDQDARRSERYAVVLSQGGLGLPDRDFYLLDESHFLGIREHYLRCIETMLGLAGVAEAGGSAKAAARVLALEVRLAGGHWTQVQSRDAEATYNRCTLADLAGLAPAVDWPAYLAGLGAEAETEVVVSQPSFLEAFGEALAGIPVEHWRAYLAWHLLNAYASYLSRPFVETQFEFFGRILSGMEENRPRWKRSVAELDTSLGEALGRLYVERHFPPAAKARMLGLVENLKAAFRMSFESLDWMGPETRARALAKLATFTTKIGYPDVWRDYSALEIRPDDLVGNVMRARRFDHNRRFGRLGRPVDRSEWFMTPQTVNAYYNPTMNEIVFPAAILQPPFFDPAADDAVNYGAIGAIIGHEIGHGFDDQGRKFDGDGNLADWWTEEDAREFTARARRLVEQFNGYEVLDGMRINGELTLGENIGDLGGLTVAYRAYRLSLGGREAPVLGGFTGDQRFFMGWAQIWRNKIKDEEMRKRLLTDPHSPAPWRVAGPVANMAEFHAAFSVGEGDALYRKPGDRVRIW